MTLKCLKSTDVRMKYTKVNALYLYSPFLVFVATQGTFTLHRIHTEAQISTTVQQLVHSGSL